MSIQTIVHGYPEPPVPVDLTTGNVTGIRTAGSKEKSGVWIPSVLICNDQGTAKQCTLFYYNGTANQTLWMGQIAANETEIIETNIYLRAGDALRAQAETANFLWVTANVFLTNPFGVNPQ